MAALEFTRRYAMAHRLIADPASKCAVPHGHNEYVTVRLTPHRPFAFGGANAVAPFEQIKGRWHRFIDEAVDHSFMLNEADPLLTYFREREPAHLARIMTFPGDPSTEALAACLFLKLSAFLAADALPFDLEELRIEETPTNTVVMRVALLNDTGLAPESWPRRADMTINDF
ncbi:MAG: 6-pyruvoyl tetrahydropterin synthase family protein [Hyphomonadaceae bacterium]